MKVVVLEKYILVLVRIWFLFTREKWIESLQHWWIRGKYLLYLTQFWFLVVVAWLTFLKTKGHLCSNKTTKDHCKVWK